MWDNLAATAVSTQMCDDSETVMNMFPEKEGDEIGLAPTLSECRIASSVISALSKATHFAQTLAMPESGAGAVYDLHLQKRPLNLCFKLNESDVRSVVEFVVFLRLLCSLLLHQSSTQNIDKDTFNSHMHQTKDAFITLGPVTWSTRIDEIEKLSEEYFLPAKIHELREKLKRGKGAGVKFKQIDKIELELALLERKLADVESGMKYVLTGFTHVMTRMEGLVSEMKALKTEIAMEAESSKGKAKWSKSGYNLHLYFSVLPRLKALANDDTLLRTHCFPVCPRAQHLLRTQKMFDFVQKHFVPATNVSQFAQPKKHHWQQCVRNNVSSFTRALT